MDLEQNGDIVNFDLLSKLATSTSKPIIVEDLLSECPDLPLLDWHIVPKSAHLTPGHIVQVQFGNTPRLIQVDRTAPSRA